MRRFSFSAPRRLMRFCLLAGFGLALFLPQIAAACPGCNYVANGSVGRGFNMSVLFLMAMPFLVAGTIGLSLVWVARNQRPGSSPRHAQSIATIHLTEEAAN